MNFWYTIQSHKWNSGGWILIFVCSLVFLFLNRERLGERVKKLCMFILLSILLYYCQIFATLTLKAFLPSFLEYERLSWLFLTREVIAFAFVVVVSKIDRRKRTVACVCFLVFCLCISNAELVTNAFRWPDNPYKVSDEVIDVSETLIKCVKEDRPRVMVQSYYCNPDDGDEMYYGIRQYTSKLVLTTLVLDPCEFETEEFDLSDYGVMGYEYFVCHNDAILMDQAEMFGFQLIHETENYCIYENNKEFTMYFVRHGQTTANVEGILAGSGTDALLTEEGIAQAKETGEALSNVCFSNVYTSELTRTIDTANTILNENNSEVPEPYALPDLNDYFWGDLEGMTIEKTMEVYPDFSIDEFTGDLNDGTFVSPVNGETKYSTNTCLRKAVNYVSAHAENEGNTLVVGHSAMIWYLQYAFPEQVKDTGGLDNASITILHYNRGVWTLEELNLSAEEFKELGL